MFIQATSALASNKTSSFNENIESFNETIKTLEENLIENQHNHLEEKIKYNSEKQDELLSLIMDNLKESNLIRERIEKKREVDVFFDIAIPLALSIISAILFWIILFRIENKRKKEIRKNIYRNFSKIRQELFFVFDIIMAPSINYNPPSSYQNKIRHEELTLEDIKTGLQNKCLSLENVTDKSIINHLHPILKKLTERFSTVENKIDLCMIYYQELTSEEIDTLEEIREKIHTYDLNSLNEIMALGVTQDLTFMKQYLFELYELHIKIQKMSLLNNSKDWKNIVNKTAYLCKKGTYRQCLKFIENQDNNKEKLKTYKLKCLLNLNNLKASKKTLIEILKKNNDVISSRYTYKDLFDNDDFKDIFIKYSSTDEIDRAKSILQKEQKHNEDFINTCLLLEQHYKNKKDIHKSLASHFNKK